MPLPASAVHPTQQKAADTAFPNGSARAGQYTLIFRIRDRKSQTILKQHSLILFPANLTQRTEARLATYYTAEDIYVDVPLKTGIGKRLFQLTGHTGFAGVRADRHNPLLDRMDSPATIDQFVATVQTVAQSISTGLPQTTSLI